MPEVTFYESEIKVTVPAGTLLMEAIRKAGLFLDAPCGGRGTCGKCRVTLLTGSAPGIYPACHFPVTEDITVKLPGSLGGNRILDSGTFLSPYKDPVLLNKEACIPKCPIGEASSDCRRVKQALGIQISFPLSVVSHLHSTLKALENRGSFVLCRDRLLRILPDKKACYVIAFDIGTTTVVSYLMDAETGRQVCVSSMQNPQTAYGADVISRCEYDVSHEGKKMTALIRSALSSLTEKNIKKSGISPEDIYFAAIAGNTCMQHLYLGISPESLISAPYTATTDELQILPAASLGLPIHPEAEAAVLPSIAGFVGGDTVGVLLSLPEGTFEKLTLILDIGTNGELVLGKGDLRFACSTAAGPAFEGAKISCGIRSIRGAIDHVSLEKGALLLSTIDSAHPSGICGSGLLDLIACLLELGILSPRGRFQRAEKWPSEVFSRYGHRMTKKGGVTAFLLTDEAEGIYLTQKDVREVQLAKSAIAAGIEQLCQAMGVFPEEIEAVLLAGAFGSYMSPESACRIGLIPPCLLKKIRGIGNAAGEGAKFAALSRDALTRSVLLAETTRFVELASSPDFQNSYLAHLDF